MELSGGYIKEEPIVYEGVGIVIVIIHQIPVDRSPESDREQSEERRHS